MLRRELGDILRYPNGYSDEIVIGVDMDDDLDQRPLMSP